ncbi:MAG: hypothetical protein ACKOU7_00180 [Ferruginibacter sp.]
MEKLEAGDVLIVTKMDRLGRNSVFEWQHRVSPYHTPVA